MSKLYVSNYTLCFIGKILFFDYKYSTIKTNLQISLTKNIQHHPLLILYYRI